MTLPIVAETERALLRRLTAEDAAFILRLLNEPSFLEHIGDKNVRTLEGAERYIAEGPLRSYQQHGHGLYLVLRKDEPPRPIGMCGLLKRDQLDGVDLGYAFVPEAWGRGYAFESASAVLEHARRELRVTRVLAIVSPGNAASIRLLGKLGFAYVKDVRMPNDAHDVRLYDVTLGSPPAA